MGSQAKRIADALRAQLAEVMKALILEIDANLRETTPVDTGHARANWVPSLGVPHTGEDDGAAHDLGIAEVLAYTLADGPGYVSNAAPYIQRLNHGWSQQAPAMFVEAAVDKAVATIQQRYAGRVDLSGLNGVRAAIGVARGLAALR